MSSAAQIAANRANAAHSTGPSTATGKATSRLNATRHGLTSQVACMPWEDRDAFKQFCSALVAEYRPEGLIETELAQSIAEDHWRLNRVRAIDHNIFALGLATSTLEIESPAVDSNDPRVTVALVQAQTFREEAKTLGLLTLYEQRINRGVQRNVERLRRIQSDRHEAREKALAILAERRSAERNAEARQADERKTEERRATMRSSDSQAKGSGLVPTNGPQEDKSLAIGFVRSNNEIDTPPHGRTLDDRLVEIEDFLSGRSSQRPIGLRTAA